MYSGKLKIDIICVVLFALFASLAWLNITPLTLFVMFVPLLFLQRRRGGKRAVPFALLAFSLWNLATTWSVGYAFTAAPLAIVLVYLAIFGSFFALYNKVWRKATRPLAYTLLVTGWIAAEYLYITGEVSFPWLTLGNGFAMTPYLVQWYEYTGVLGGSLWVLIINILIFESLIKIEKIDGKLSIKGVLSKYMIAPLVLVLVPMVYSLVVYLTYTEGVAPVEVAIIQPNIDPYNEKFGGLTQEEQEDIIFNLAAKAPSTVDYFIAPETALDNSFWLNSLTYNSTIGRVKTFMSSYPSAEFITGAVLRKHYPKGDDGVKPTFTARTSDRLSYYYDVYNSALSIDTASAVEYYHKSYLVTGAETMPYQEEFPFISEFALDLGGEVGSYGRQIDRTVFHNKNSDVSIGAAICFESINGEFYSEFVRNGANVMAIITNDGWWRDTPTHRQHLSYASLRAIENRRSIARSANTGVSAIIDQRGKIVDRAEWDESKLLVGEINSNAELTVYTKYGDYIGRVCSYIFILTILYFISYRYKKRSHLN